MYAEDTLARLSSRRSRSGVPTFEAAERALVSGKSNRAAALFGARVLANPRDWISRVNRAIALYDAERWKEAAAAFEREIFRGNIEDLLMVPAFFCLGYCLLQLGDARRSLAATTAFLDLGNDEHPWYAEGLENTACAWERLGLEAPAASLRRGGWRRERVIATSCRCLGLDPTPLPPRVVDWYAEHKARSGRSRSARRLRRR